MRLLIIEDDKDAADYIARAFREVGHVADQAGDVAEEAAHLRQEMRVFLNSVQKIVTAAAHNDMKVVADISTEAGQADFAADVIKLKGANADAVFVYLNEEESARFLREAKKQGLNKPLIGETTLLGQKVIELAGDAANGVKGHVGLTIDAPIPSVQEWSK